MFKEGSVMLPFGSQTRVAPNKRAVHRTSNFRKLSKQATGSDWRQLSGKIMLLYKNWSYGNRARIENYIHAAQRMNLLLAFVNTVLILRVP